MHIQNELIKIIEDAVSHYASDIHFTLNDDGLVIVNLRIGTTMVAQKTIDLERYNQLLTFIKFRASLNFAHPLQPVSGSITISDDSHTSHCRVSIIPTLKFQSLVLRIINNNLIKKIEQIPYFKENRIILKNIAKKESGLILIGGPTGSGKTTTAYALIDFIKSLDKSIITIEDPIEYQQKDVIQIQVNENAGMNYDVGIKEILRHDPDVIVIGEIRDQNTAKQAIRAALTGHLVISTIHSKDNLGTIYRLLDLGISKMDISQSLTALLNQRLVNENDFKKALFEFTDGQNLENIMQQIIEDNVHYLPYKTLDEEFLLWKANQEK